MSTIVMWLGMSGCLLGPTDLTDKESLLQDDPNTTSGTLAITGISLQEEIYTNTQLLVQIEMSDENGEQIDDPYGTFAETPEGNDFFSQLQVVWMVVGANGNEEEIQGTG